ncbi:MAG: tetratricopeptide repeat protein [Chloroflexota bacterium]
MVRATDRETFVSLLHAASLARRFDYARRVATDWLTAWPGDEEVRLELARTELDLGLVEPAVDRLTQVISADPECPQGYQLLARAYRQTGDAIRPPLYETCWQVLTGANPDRANSPSWAIPLARALGALSEGDAKEAVRASQEALTYDPSLPLPLVVAAKAKLAAGEFAAAVTLSEVGHDRWPEVLAFRMILALAGLNTVRRAESVAALHQLASDDPLGIVADSMLGADHLYRDLWPARMEAVLSRPVPAPVAAVLGGTYLATPVPLAAVSGSKAERVLTHGMRKMPTPEPGESFQGPDPGDRELGAEGTETLLEVQTELDRLGQRLNARVPEAGRDLRAPAYVVLSSHTRLVQELGEPAFFRVDEAIVRLVEAVRRKRGWIAYRVYVDDPKLLKGFGLAPCDPANAWQIKLRLADLDQVLRARGEMIGAVLIVGGHNIVPFHLLPNPTDDDDDLVPSDNPYATSAENYFAPEWAVGRLPSDTDADLLVKLLHSSAEAHRQQQTSFSGFGVWLRDSLGRFLHPQPTAVGYSASIWRKASLAVFQTIGAPRSLITSPPAQAGAMPGAIQRSNGLSYFNLHGLETSPEWFGQRDPLRDHTGEPDFPVALRPQDVVNEGRAPKVVFTEACYGAHVIGKTSETALSLKFLASGSQAVVGSTKISYGAISPPLIAADLIGRLFWDELRRGMPAGEALRRSKLKLVAEMHGRQGFLDGEDQKTLISFVLYGDPLYSPAGLGHRGASKQVTRHLDRPKSMKTTCALGGPDLLTVEPDLVTTDKVRSIVAKYLPSMADANCRLHTQHWGCSDPNHACPTQQIGIKSIGEGEVYVLTLGKKTLEGVQLHPRFARVTMDKSGKILKLAVSR